MPSHTGRLYAVAGALVVLFLGWAAVAAHPWDAAPVDPRVAALTERRAQVREDAAKAKRVVAARWNRYQARLADRRRAVDLAWHRRKRAEAIYQRRLAVARANRPVIVRTVYARSGPGGSAPASSASTGSGGYVAAVASSGSASAPAAAAPAAAAAPPVVSVGAAAPVTASGSS
jgi:hypothetical protein